MSENFRRRSHFLPRLLPILALLPLVAVSPGTSQTAAPHHHAAPAALPAAAPAPGGGPVVVDIPTPDVGADTLAARGAAEKATVDQFKVFHGFQFADRLPESGITFVHGIVEDAGKRYKAAHYDHGTGIAV